VGIVIGAPEFAYNGKEFWTVTTDFSGCKNMSYYSDCRQSKGSSRIENRAKSDKSVGDGKEKWIHYAIKPVNNILFPGNNNRRFTIGQCHPGDNGNHMGLTWMLRIRAGQLYFAQWFKHHDFNYQKEDGGWGIRHKWIGQDVSWKVTHDKLKDFRPDIKEGMKGVGADGEGTSRLVCTVDLSDQYASPLTVSTYTIHTFFDVWSEVFQLVVCHLPANILSYPFVSDPPTTIFFLIVEVMMFEPLSEIKLSCSNTQHPSQSHMIAIVAWVTLSYRESSIVVSRKQYIVHRLDSIVYPFLFAITYALITFGSVLNPARTFRLPTV
jgi:hypothetical protein